MLPVTDSRKSPLVKASKASSAEVVSVPGRQERERSRAAVKKAERKRTTRKDFLHIRLWLAGPEGGFFCKVEGKIVDNIFMGNHRNNSWCSL